MLSKRKSLIYSITKWQFSWPLTARLPATLTAIFGSRWIAGSLWATWHLCWDLHCHRGPWCCLPLHCRGFASLSNCRGHQWEWQTSGSTTRGPHQCVQGFPCQVEKDSESMWVYRWSMMYEVSCNSIGIMKFHVWGSGVQVCMCIYIYIYIVYCATPGFCPGETWADIPLISMNNNWDLIQHMLYMIYDVFCVWIRPVYIYIYVTLKTSLCQAMAVLMMGAACQAHHSKMSG